MDIEKKLNNPQELEKYLLMLVSIGAELKTLEYSGNYRVYDLYCLTEEPKELEDFTEMGESSGGCITTDIRCYPVQVTFSLPKEKIPEPDLTCSHKCVCGGSDFVFYPMVFMNGVINLKRYCKKCGLDNAYAPQKMDKERLAAFVMPIGKHKGTTLQELKDKEYNYLLWCYENMTNKIGDKIREYLAPEKA